MTTKRKATARKSAKGKTTTPRKAKASASNAAPVAATPTPKEPRPPINIGPQTVTVIFDGRPHTVAKSVMVAQAIRAEDWAELRLLASPAHAIAAKAQALDLRQIGELRVTDAGLITFKGRAVNNASAQRITELVREGFPITSELRTLASLLRHDDPRVIASFEAYLDRWRIPRLEDGRIVLVKRAKTTSTPGVYTAHNDFAWKIGETAREGWDVVDRDPASTCSRGLHACPLAGLSNFNGHGDAVLELHVWPEHIAALPNDYLSNGKVRLVEAFCARELTGDLSEANLSGRA